MTDEKEKDIDCTECPHFMGVYCVEGCIVRFMKDRESEVVGDAGRRKYKHK